MKATNKTILELVKKYPNNLELGDAVRKLSWDILKEENINEIYVNPNQVTLDDIINEVKKTEDNGTTRL